MDMIWYVSKMKKQLTTLLAMVTLLSACGSGDSSESEAVKEPVASVDVTTERTINASSLTPTSFVPSPKIAGKVVGGKIVAQAGQLNATGGFEYPANNSQFDGNLTLFVNADDPDGVQGVYLFFAGQEQSLALCNNDCGSSFSALVNGISPVLFGWQNGQNTLELWVEDSAESMQQVASLALNWSSEVVSGVSASFGQTNDQLTISWSANADLLRYNVYVAEEPVVTGPEVLDLQGGDAQLGVESNSVTFTGKDIETAYYIMVTGIDGTGESAFSEMFALAGGTRIVPPTAVNDQFIVDEDGTLLGNVMENDSTPSGSTISTVTTPIVAPRNGSLSLQGDGTFEYTPATNFNGTDQFTYQVISTDQLVANAVVTITINPVNDAPIANGETYDIEGGSLTISAPGVLGNDTDVDQDTLSVVLDTLVQPEFGSLDISENGQFTYTPTEGFTTFDSFQYQVTDGSLTSEFAEVNISLLTVGGIAPVAVNDDYSVDEDNLLEIPASEGLLNNDSDADTPLSSISIGVTNGVNNGQLVVASDGSFTYDPNTDFFGTDSFTYRLQDPEGNVATAVVTIVVNSVNDAPSAVSEQYVVIADQTNSIFKGIGILSNDSDADGDALSIVFDAVVGPSSGSLNLNEDGSFEYIPNEGFTGLDSFTYEVADGELNSGTATVQLTVVETHGSIADTETAEITLEEVISNLPDDATIIEISAENGSVVISNGVITYTPALGIGGLDVITVQIEIDGEVNTLEFYVMVDSSNSAPVITSASTLTINESRPSGTVIYQASATDADEHSITYSATGIGSSFTINSTTGELLVANQNALNYEQSSQINITVIATDEVGASDSQLLQITVLDINEAPDISGASAFTISENLPNETVLTYSVSAVDPEGNQFLWSIVSDVYDIFAIDSETGAMSVADNTNLDFESVESYNISIRAQEIDGSPSNLSQTLTVTVNITDVDEITDTDEDGLFDSEEAFYGSDINDPDSDDDGLNDYEEVEIGTSPIDSDTDNDLISDGDEVTNGTDPLNSDVVAPLVNSVDPSNGLTDVCVNQLVTVNFNEPINSDSVSATSFKLLQGSIEVEGTFTLSENGYQIVFKSDAAFSENTIYTVEVAGVKDLAGNALAATFQSDFTTGTCVESVKPTVLSISPLSGSQNVPLNTVATVVMDEAIDVSSVNSSTVYVIDQISGENVPGTVSLSGNGTIITFTPSSSYGVSRRHYVYITTGIRDLFGNTFNGTSFYFDTAFSSDSMAPTIENTSVPNGYTGLPLNGILAVQFNEPVDQASLTSVRIEDGQSNTISATVSVSHDQRRVALQPDSDLLASTTYNFIISGVKDVGGNVLAASETITFTTGAELDSTTGDISNWSVTHSASGVALNPLLKVNFSERIDPTTLFSSTMYLWDATTGRSAAAEIEVAEDGMSASLVLAEPLEAGHAHYFYVGYSPFIKDLAGNNVAQNRYVYFVTGDSTDNTALAITQSSILDGAANMPINGRVVVTFDQPLSDVCDLSSVTLMQGSTEIAITGTLSNNRMTYTFTADNNLDPDTLYTLSIGGLCDYAGNVITTTTYDFTTNSSTSEDTTGPTLVSMTPAHTSTGIDVNTSIVLEYNEDVDLMSRPPVSGGDITVPGDYSVSGNTITFTPSISLLGDTRYTVSLSYNVPDLAGNVAWGSTRYFDTGAAEDTTAPVLVSSSPSSGQIGSNPNQDIVLTFSEPILQSTLVTNNLKLYHNGQQVFVTIYRSADGQEVTLVGGKDENQIIDVILTDRITDVSGNALAPTIVTFTTGQDEAETDRPAISQQIPSNGSSGWTNINEIYFYADELLDPASLEGEVQIAENGVLIEAAIELMGDGHTIKITKATNFTEGARVQIYLGDGITDLAGNHLYSYEGYFFMDSSQERDGVGAYVESFFPYNGIENVPTNPVVLVKFNEDIDPLSLQPGRILLQDADNSFSDVPVTMNIGINDQIVEVRPESELTPGNLYYLWVSSELKDTGGDNVRSNFSNYFTVASEAVMDDRQPIAKSFSPPSGEQGVGINAEFTAEFDETINPISFVHDKAVNVQFSASNTIVKYNRYEPLVPNESHTEQLPLIVDIAGNEVVATSSTFTTADGPDFVNPFVIDTSFSSNEENVPTVPVFEWTFSEPIDRNSVTSNGVYIWDTRDGEIIPSTFELTADGKRLSVVPSEPLKVLRNYYQYTYYLRDLSGNALSNTWRYIETGLDSDEIGPVIVSSTIDNNQLNVPTNTRLHVRFDEPLNPLSLSGVSLTNENGDDIEFNVDIDRSRTRLTIVPTQLLSPFNPYVLTVEGVSDTSGNLQQNNFVRAFTTGSQPDILTSAISRWSIPVNGTTNVALNPLLQVTFGEEIDPTSLDTSTMYLWDSQRSRAIAGQVSLSTDRRTATLTLGELLRANGTYYLYAGYSPYITDFGGNNVGQNNYRYFVTRDEMDNASPVVSATNFANGTAIVPVNGQIQLTFDEPLSDACALEDHITLASSSGEHGFSASLSSDRLTVTVAVDENMATSTDYTVSVNGLCDYSGNTISNYNIGFTTLANDTADTTGPSLVSMTPAHLASGVSTSITSIVMQFDEDVDLRSAPPITGGGITLPGSYSVSGDTITFTPSIELTPNTRYTINLYYNVPDLAGNTLWGSTRYFNTDTTAEFTSPTVAAITPAPGAVDVDPSQAIVVTFSEPMAQSPLSADNIGIFSNGSLISSSKSRSVDGQKLTLSANLPSNALVTLVINSNVTDLSGNGLAPYSMSFTTGTQVTDNARPQVVRQIPSSGNSSRTSLQEFTIYMSEAMDASELSDVLVMEEEGVEVQGEITVSGDGRIIKVSKDGGFTPGARTTFYLSGMRDVNGNYMYDHSGYITLTTDSDGVGVKPYVTAYYPTNGTAGTPLNPIVLTRFTEPMDELSLTSENVLLYDITNSSTLVDIEVSVTDDPNVVAVTPTADLLQDNQYYLWFGSSILDTDGDNLLSNYATYFQTAADAVVDDTQPMVSAMSPPDGESGIGINTRFSLRYNEPINSVGYDASGEKENVQFSEDNMVVTYETLHPLLPDTENTISTDGETDLAGNVVIAQSNTFNVTDGPDLVQPSLVDVFIANNSQDVVINPVVRWQYDEPIDIVSITSSGVYIWDNTEQAVVPSNWELSQDGKRISVTPQANLTAGNQYYFYAYYLRDLSGNTATSGFRYFTAGSTKDTTAPTVVTTTVEEGDTDVPLNGKINVRFSESLNLVDEANVTLVDSSNNSESVIVALSRERELLTVTPKRLMTAGETYTLTVTGVEDLSGNVMSGSFVLNFTAADTADLVRGTISTWSIPVNNTQDVPLNPLLRVTFSEKIDEATLDSDSVYLWNNTINEVVPSSWSLSADKQTLTLTPDEDLDADSQFYFYVGYTPYITDYAGNRIYNNFRYFTTGDQLDTTAITISNTNIASGSMDMPVNGRAILVTDTPISDACLYTDNIVLQNSAGEAVDVGFSLDSSRQHITITPTNDLTTSSTYNVVVSSLCDYAGNEFSGTPLSFTTLSDATADTTGPTLVSISPFNGETGVSITSSIVMQYNESIDRRSAPVVKAGTTVIPGSYVVSGDTITFTPTDPLSSTTTYTVELFYNVPDFAGRTANGGSTTFTTVD